MSKIPRTSTARCGLWVTLALVASVASASCGHTKGSERPTGASQEGGEQHESKERAPKANDKRPAAQGEPNKARENGQAPIMSEPHEMVRPDAMEKIQRKLVRMGLLKRTEVGKVLDDSVEEAIARFQGDNSLPATGMLDRATVKALGFDPDEVFVWGQDD